MGHGTHDKLPRAQIFGRSALGAYALGRYKLRLNRRRHALRYVVLQFEYVGEVAVVVLSPEVRSAYRVDQLRRDSYAISTFRTLPSRI